MEQKAVELLEHGLKDMLDAERRFADSLAKMEQNAGEESLANSFRRHREITKNQARRLEQAFEEMDKRPETEECAAAKGLVEEYEKFTSEHDGNTDFHDAFAATAGLKVEHYEIASYRAMVDLAEFCDLDGVSRLLKQNLAEEEQGAAEMQSAASELGAKLAGASAAAVAGRAVGGMVSQAREGTFAALGGAKAVGARAAKRVKGAVDTAEKRGRKVRSQGRQRAKTTTRKAKAGTRKAASRAKSRAKTAGSRARTASRAGSRKATGSSRKKTTARSGTRRRSSR